MTAVEAPTNQVRRMSMIMQALVIILYPLACFAEWIQGLLGMDEG